jgi:hypothetical protein
VVAELFTLVFCEKKRVIAGDRVDLNEFSAECLLLAAIQTNLDFANRAFTDHGVGIRVCHLSIIVWRNENMRLRKKGHEILVPFTYQINAYPEHSDEVASMKTK